MRTKSKALLRNDNAPARLSTTRRNATKNAQSPDATIDPVAVVPHPGDFPDNVAPFNLIKKAHLTEPLVFTAPLYPAMDSTWLYRLYMDGIWDGAEHLVTQADIDANQLTMALEPDVYVINDAHAFIYDCKSELETVWNPPCDPVMFTVDLDPPGQPVPGELEFPDDVHENGLTDARLTELGDILEGEVPSYMDRIHGDTVVGFVESADGATELRSEPVRIPYGQSNAELLIPFPRALLEQAGDGLLTFTYEITDLAGNVSARSEPTIIDVYLTPGIADLEPPLVPLYDDDDDNAPNIKLINEEDARTPVEVHIPGHEGIEIGDRIVVLWGTREQPPVTFAGPDSEAPVILEIEIPYGEVSGEWADATQDEDGFATIPVNYVVFRGDREVGRPAAPHNVVVNLNQAGGQDPDPETPENEALGAPVVHHSQWNNDRENFIPDASIEEDHEFIVPFFTRDENGNPTGTPAFTSTDLIVARYGEIGLTPVSVQPPDMVNEEDIVITLPWEIVKAAGSGTHDIQYTVTRYINPTLEENISISPLAQVEAVDSSDNPGGPDGLEPCDFDEANILWSYVEPNRHAPITVRAYQNMRAGDVVRVHVTADEFLSGEMGDPYPYSEWGGDNGIYPHPVYDFEKTVTPDTVDMDLSFGYPKERAEWTYPYGYIRVSYSVTRADGVTKATAPPSADKRTDMTGRGEPPTDIPEGARRMTTAELLSHTRGKTAEQRQAALNEFVRLWRTSPSRRKQLRQRRLNGGARTPAQSVTGELTPLQEKLRQISLRPAPKLE
ncbi:hypothetical protein [Pandoraea oxalativorans]|uniref:Uncharacterized protein n=1 Tax=Pandoraea oxalativorans TaxID=573737 RepID=A0A0E3YEY9_9BURK|nr:hypothetical protein [Pandoraea oxalativorans]AKC71611.1 hypothetical protein MB84_22365 [Pandoraea oxalativorans]